jgi:hypothetical protein
MPDEHLARPALDDMQQPRVRLQRLDTFDPAHRAKGLAEQRIADALHVLFDRHIDVVERPESAGAGKCRDRQRRPGA